MKFFRFFRNKRVLIYIAGFALAGAGFVFSDAILKQNSLKITGEGAHQQGEYGALVNWLPEEAKIAIEYRARSLYLQNRMRRTKNPDMRVRAVYEFGDYIRYRDPKGSDSVFASIIDRKEFSSSRYSFLGFGELLLNSDSSRPVSVEEFHACVGRLRWPEDIYQAWEHVQKMMNKRRMSPVLRCQIYAPLLKKYPPYRNFERFMNDLSSAAGKCKDLELQKQALAARDACRKMEWIPSALLKAPVTYRENYASYEEELKNAKDNGEKIQALTVLGRLARGIEEKKSLNFFYQILDDPVLSAEPASYQAHAYLLLYSRSSRKVTISRYHHLLKKITSDEMLYLAWEAGFRQLLENKNSEKVQLQYLLPLLDLKKEYVEYSDLFRHLSNLTLGKGHEEQARKVSAFLLRVQETEMPSLFNQDIYPFGKRF